MRSGEGGESGGDMTLGVAADTQGQGAGFGGDAKMTGKEAAHALDDYWKHMPTEVLLRWSAKRDCFHALSKKADK